MIVSRKRKNGGEEGVGAILDSIEQEALQTRCHLGQDLKETQELDMHISGAITKAGAGGAASNR